MIGALSFRNGNAPRGGRAFNTYTLSVLPLRFPLSRPCTLALYQYSQHVETAAAGGTSRTAGEAAGAAAALLGWGGLNDDLRVSGGRGEGGLRQAG
jgi:hypothetical protein